MVLSQIPLFHFFDRKVGGSGGEGHVGEGGVHAACGGHAGAVGDEDVFDFVDLVVLVEHGGLWVFAHAGGAHLVDGGAGVGFVVEGLDVD